MVSSPGRTWRFGNRSSRQYSSTLSNRSSSPLRRVEESNITGITPTRARKVVLNATESPWVTPLRADRIWVLNSEVSTPRMNWENSPIDCPIPKTVPMNPRIGIAQMKTLIRVYPVCIRL